MRLIDVLMKGVVVAPDTETWTGPWLGATRRPCLQRVANRAIICHVLDSMVEAGVLEVAVVASPEGAEEIRACVAAEGPDGVAVRHLPVDPNDGGDALVAVAEFVGHDACLLHRANGLLGQALLPYVELLQGEETDVLVLVADDPGGARRLKVVPERPSADPRATSISTAGYAGACLLGPGELQRLTDLAWTSEVHDFAPIADQLARRGRRTEVRVTSGWRHFSDDPADLLDMNRAMLDALEGAPLPSARDGNHFEGPIVIHPTARVISSVIVGPVLIGADALVAESYIGPHTSIAERVHIEGAELERSIVLADASVLHVGGRLVASIIGRNARIFRDFSVPRALRLQVGDGDEVALC